MVKTFAIGELAPGERQFNLTAATIIKNEAEFIAEWLAFHQVQGVEHFYIFDNGSTDDIAAVLQPWLAAGLATLIPWPRAKGREHTQTLAYRHALKAFGARTRWMMFIDVDEFIYSPGGRPVCDVLQGYADLPALLVYRQTFGTSGHISPPAGLVIDTYTQRTDVERTPITLKGNLSPKSIVKPDQVVATHGAHRFFLKGLKAFGYDENRVPLLPQKDAVFTAETLCINHYYTKDRTTFQKRIMRGVTASNVAVSEARWRELLAETDGAATHRDTRIQRFSSATAGLLAKMQDGRLPSPAPAKPL